MAETSGFFDAEELTDGTFDREYIAEQWANYFKLFIGNGVFINPTNQLKVVAGEGMQVIIKQGWAFINGYWYHNDSDLAITVPVNSTPSTVNSGVFVQFNSQNRTVTTILANGRTEVDRELPRYELKLAEVSVATGTTAITDSMITDTRTDENVCGFVEGLLRVETTEDLFLQFQAIFEEWYASIRAEYEDLAEELRDIIDDEAAGHLQLEIDDIRDTMVAIEECTEEEYEALTPAEKMDGKIRIVGDQDGQTHAAVIKYDNTESGMSAGNVQAAIDEIYNMRYNSQTNYIEVKKNGTWYNYKYFDPTSQPLVPIMTSNTTPYGVAGSNSVLNTNYQAFKVFDNDDTLYWECVQNASHPYVYYKFREAVYVDKAYVKFYDLPDVGVGGRTVKLRYSDDGINWYDCSSVVAPTSISFYIDSDERNAHQYWALYFETVSTSGWAAVSALQFYGYETAV